MFLDMGTVRFRLGISIEFCKFRVSLGIRLEMVILGIMLEMVPELWS